MIRFGPVQTISFFEMKSVLKSKKFWSISLLTLSFWWFLKSQPTTKAEERMMGENLSLMPLQITIGSLTLIAGIIVGAQAISGKVESGEIKSLLSFPSTRSELLVGIVAGRSLSLFIAQMAAISIALAYTVLLNSPPHVVSVAIFIFSVLIYSVVTVSVGVLASSMMQSSAASTTIGVVFIFATMLWTALARKLYTLVTGRVVNTAQPPADPILFGLVRLFPRDAFFVATNWAMGAANVAGAAYLAIPEESPERIVVDYTFSGFVPIYLRPWFGVVILLLWIPAMLLPAHFLFKRSDIN